MTGCAGPGIIRRGRRACRTGLVASTPELSVRGPGWLRMWGVAGSPSVHTLSEGDALSSPELTARADGDAVDWNAPRSVTYGCRGGIYNYRLPRHALPEVRDLLCALPRNDPSREARNGKVLGRTPTFYRDRGSGKFSRWESAVFSGERENGAGLAGRTGTEERVRVAGTGVSYVTGRSGEWNGAGGMFTND